jgi:hypothetical protein
MMKEFNLGSILLRRLDKGIKSREQLGILPSQFMFDGRNNVRFALLHSLVAKINFGVESYDFHFHEP